MHAQLLYAPVARGPNQSARTTDRDVGDALALMVLTWPDRSEPLKFAIYCSDVSGTFDKFRRERLGTKLKPKGIHNSIVAVLSSWLRDKMAKIPVGGESPPFPDQDYGIECTKTPDKRPRLNETKRCQSHLHAWGKAIQAQSDPAKESMHAEDGTTCKGPISKYWASNLIANCC